jgi:hypothetical protein
MPPNARKPVTSPSKKKQSKDRADGTQQLNLSSFFTAPKSTKEIQSEISGVEKGKAVDSRLQGKSRQSKASTHSKTSKSDQGIITLHDSSEEEASSSNQIYTKVKSEASFPPDPFDNGHDDTRATDGLETNGLLGLHPATPFGQPKQPIPSGSKEYHVIELDNSDTDSDVGVTAPKRKRKASSLVGSRSSSPIHQGPDLKKVRATTPPSREVKPSVPGTPSKMLQLTAPLNPSPSKKKRTHDCLQDSTEPMIEDEEVKPVLAFFQPRASTSTTTTDPTMKVMRANLTAPPLDFDTDPFLFRPQDIDISQWPGGKLPYEVLVGVYLQVGGTRSRLAIVRILTK